MIAPTVVRTERYDSRATPIENGGKLRLNIYGGDIQYHCEDPDFLRWLQFLLPLARFDPLASDDLRPESIIFEIKVNDPEHPKRKTTVIRNSEWVFESKSLSKVQWFLERELLKRASGALTEPFHMVHSAAAAKNGKGVLLPAASKSGKSTLVAALSMSGYDYYSDEIGVLTSDRKLLPFPKTITLKQGGWQAVHKAFPASIDRTYSPANGNKFRHLMAPLSQPPSNLESALKVDYIVIPKFHEGQEVELTRVSRSIVMREFARRSMNWTNMGVESFRLVANVIQGAECYSLKTNDLRDAVAAISSLVDA